MASPRQTWVIKKTIRRERLKETTKKAWSTGCTHVLDRATLLTTTGHSRSRPKTASQKVDEPKKCPVILTRPVTAHAQKERATAWQLLLPTDFTRSVSIGIYEDLKDRVKEDRFPC
ncbi:uncharacterized protein LOC118420960 [Branchiostoma floridae]|uniref:Uncharacterized protein LOC118420960 n=1 Tax=Branchiostoma floridae TaxID=7739 RepID=A0A9J7LLI4_BRAFL|nr:uncharacterized protein LOC118420960 [Branchiostoma floridae]